MTGNLTSNSSDPEFFTFDIQMFRGYIDYAVIGPIAALGIFGNILTVFIFIGMKEKHAYHCYILFLSVFDLLYCIIHGGGLIARSSRAMFMYYHWYGIHFASRFAAANSYMLVALMSLDRLMFMVWPMKFIVWTKKRGIKMIYITIGIVIFITLCLHIPYLFAGRNDRGKSRNPQEIFNKMSFNNAKTDLTNKIPFDSATTDPTNKMSFNNATTDLTNKMSFNNATTDPTHKMSFNNATTDPTHKMSFNNAITDGTSVIVLQEAVYAVTHHINSACFIYMPIIVVLVANLIVIIMLRRRIATIAGLQQGQQRNEAENNIKVTRMLLCMAVVFLLCIGVGLAVIRHQTVTEITGESNFDLIVLEIYRVLRLINHSINFLIYVLWTDIYRKYYKNIICCCFKYCRSTE